MADRENDYTLTAQAISKLLDFQGQESPEEDDSGQATDLPESVEAPKIVHLEFGDPIAAAVAEETALEEWEQPLGRARRRMFAPRGGVSAAGQKKMAMLIPILSVILLVVLNKFHNMPFLKSEWLKLGTYRAMVGDLVESGTSTSKDANSRPVTLKVRGIAFSQENPSAIIGSTIVHEGDLVLGATVVKIGRDGVVFEVNGETWTQKVQ